MPCNPKVIRKAAKLAQRNASRRSGKSCGYCGCCPCYQVGCDYCPAGGKRKRETVRDYLRRRHQQLYAFDDFRISEHRRMQKEIPSD